MTLILENRPYSEKEILEFARDSSKPRQVTVRLEVSIEDIGAYGDTYNLLECYSDDSWFPSDIGQPMAVGHSSDGNVIMEISFDVPIFDDEEELD